MNPVIVLLATVFWVGAAVAQSSSSAPATECQFHILADDSFELFINGISVWKASDYQNVLQKTLPLRRGDIVAVAVTDKQGGPGGSFAALILRNNAVLASSKDFRYTVNPTPDFTTSPGTQKLRAPDLEPLRHSFGLGPDKQPKQAWTQKSDRKYGVVHFKYVVSQ